MSQDNLTTRPRQRHQVTTPGPSSRQKKDTKNCLKTVSSLTTEPHTHTHTRLVCVRVSVFTALMRYQVLLVRKAAVALADVTHVHRPVCERAATSCRLLAVHVCWCAGHTAWLHHRTYRCTLWLWHWRTVDVVNSRSLCSLCTYTHTTHAGRITARFLRRPK